MHIISRKKLVLFWEEYPETKDWLSAWFRNVTKATWSKWAEVTHDYQKASSYKCCIVFNVGGKPYRLVVRRAVNWKTLFVVGIYTHAEYDRDKWKKRCACW
jgi:mRNA interferase HigB